MDEPKPRFDTYYMSDGTVLTIDLDWVFRLADGGIVMFPTPKAMQ